MTFPLLPVLVTPVVLALAEACRRGAGLAEDPDGLVRAAPEQDEHRVVRHLDRLLAERSMTLAELADRVGVTVVHRSARRNGRVRAVRFSTLTATRDVLDRQPGDVLSVRSSSGTRSGPATART